MVAERKSAGFSFPKTVAVPDDCEPSPAQRFSSPELPWDEESQAEYLR